MEDHDRRLRAAAGVKGRRLAPGEAPPHISAYAAATTAAAASAGTTAAAVPHPPAAHSTLDFTRTRHRPNPLSTLDLITPRRLTPRFNKPAVGPEAL